MSAVVTVIVLIVAAIGLFLFGRAQPRNGLSALKYAAFAPIALALVIIIATSVTTVGARSVGVVVAFGRVSNVFGSGLHFKAPWESVQDFPSTIQTVRLTNQQGVSDVEGGPVTVRLGNQTTAQVNVTVQWQINTSDHPAVETLYAKYRSFDHIGPNLFVPQLQHALLPPFENFDPLQQLQAGATSATVPTSQLETQARDELTKTIGDGIQIVSFAINLVQYDQTTQDKLNNYAQAIGDTRIAEQQENTAAAQAKANDQLAASQATANSGVLYQNCLSMTERLVTAGKALPAAWSCSGSGAQAVVPVK